MRRPASTAALWLVLIFLDPRPASAALEMNEGLWETTITADGQSRSLGTNCYTTADVEEMERVLRGVSTQPGGACHYSDFTQSGNTVRYTMICRNGDDEQSSTVAAVYQGDSATGTLTTSGVTVTTTSRRVGSCTQSSFSH